ncbi:hypothetical protein GCM10018962_88840 [Dactylosporangium matsuzakiense]|uniref:DUF4184 family protein n=1 Tax=Dactylosporangium matsuzakiense TaxID=53360 RepID=A0A9W6NLB3_9ACTN|nr:hypothetical protein GCM10017581_029250 [Dactylosporangium matsuzakiense]
MEAALEADRGGQHRAVPSTLPTHPLAVLPLKLWKPRWFDGVALATGACAPDFAYALDGPGILIPSHTIAALFWWSLPTAVVVAQLCRWGAPAVAANLPPWFHVRDFGVLGRVRYRWWITASSALLGAVSHLLWDLVTHPGPVAAWWPIREASDAAAVILMPVFFLYVAVRRKLREWHGEPPALTARPGRFWGVTAAVLGAGCALTLALGDREYYTGHVHVFLVRLMVAGALALLAGALAVQSQRADDRAPRAAALSRR